MKDKNHSKTKALLIDIAGFGCIIAAPFLGWLPGPGGIPLLILGLSLLANNHEWAERILEKVKRRFSDATQKVSNASPAMSWAIDILSVVFIAAAVILFMTVTKNLYIAAAVSMTIVGATLLFTNQDRYKRAWNTFQKKHKHK